MSKTQDDSKLTKLHLAAGYMLVEPVKNEEKTASGIYLPDNAKGEKPQEGTVLSVGPDDINEHGVKKSSPAKVGDVVIYKKWGGNETKLDGKDYMFVKFDDILATIS